jgi:hypothetical protein
METERRASTEAPKMKKRRKQTDRQGKDESGKPEGVIARILLRFPKLELPVMFLFVAFLVCTGWLKYRSDELEEEKFRYERAAGERAAIIAELQYQLEHERELRAQEALQEEWLHRAAAVIGVAQSVTGLLFALEQAIMDPKEPVPYFKMMYERLSKAAGQIEAAHLEYSKAGHGAAINISTVRDIVTSAIEVAMAMSQGLSQGAVLPEGELRRSEEIVRAGASVLRQALYESIQHTYDPETLARLGVERVFKRSWSEYSARAVKRAEIVERLINAKAAGAPPEDVSHIERELVAFDKED